MVPSKDPDSKFKNASHRCPQKKKYFVRTFGKIYLFISYEMCPEGIYLKP